MILDCVGSSFWEQNIKSLAVDGRWIVYGLLGGGNVTGNLLGNVLRKRASLIGTTLKSRSLAVSSNSEGSNLCGKSLSDAKPIQLARNIP